MLTHTRAVLAGLLCVGLLGASVAAQAREAASSPWTRLQAGISDAPDTPNTEFFLLSHGRPHARLPIGLDFVVFNVGHIGRHPSAPEGSDEPVQFGSIQLGYDLGRFTLASGLALVTNVTQYLSSGYQFHSHLGFRLGRFELGLGHLSNARTRQPNKGESYLSLGFHF